jgi:hypothetical protein
MALRRNCILALCLGFVLASAPLARSQADNSNAERAQVLQKQLDELKAQMANIQAQILEMAKSDQLLEPGTEFHQSNYSAANIIWNPFGSLNVGTEVLYGWLIEKNKSKANDTRVMFSASTTSSERQRRRVPGNEATQKH